jgi:predicted ATPase
LVEQCLQLAERLQDRELLGYGYFLMGNILFWFGELIPARVHLEQGIAIYDPDLARSSAAQHGFDSCSASRSFLSRVLWHLGFPDQALINSDQAISIADEVSQPFGQCHALSWAAALHQLRGEVQKARKHADVDLAIATEQVIPFFAAHGLILRAWALVEQGQRDEGVAQLRKGLIAYRATGAELERPHWLGLMAEACTKTGQIEEALSVVSEALAATKHYGIRYYAAELNRLEGDLRLGLNTADAKGAEVCFRRAIDIARAQQARSFELRASTSLARLWRDQGKCAEAREMLGPIYNRFTEGFDTPDLKEAKALLDELA